MAVLPIVIAPDSRLLLLSEEVVDVNEEIQTLAKNMLETTYKNNGLGLAAIQVGVNKRLFVADIPNDYNDIDEVDGFQSTGGPFFIVNPKITYLSKEMIALEEGCLSVPSQQEVIRRPRLVTLEYLDFYGNKQILNANGWLSRCCQHEIDHLNGKLYIDHLSKLKYNIIMQKLKKLKKSSPN